MNEQDLDKLEADIREESALITKLIDEIGNVIVGQKYVI